MSAVCILVPVVIAGWPAFSAAVVAAATSLGYVVADDLTRDSRTVAPRKSRSQINLEMPNTELVTGQLGRAQCLRVTRDGVTVTFSRDARGKAGVCVMGNGHSDETLRTLGGELSRRVVQEYVHQRLLDEARARGFVIVEDEVDETRAIHMKIRHWEN